MTATMDTAHSIANILTESNFDVRIPGWVDAVHLKINVRNAFCDLTIGSSGAVEWDYRAFAGGNTHPGHLVGIALNLLSPSGDATDSPELTTQPDATFQDLVAQALAGRGLQVNWGLPRTEEDKQYPEDYIEVTATNPAEPGRGWVFVTDYGAVHWTCTLRDQAEGSEGLSLDEIGKTLARALTNTPPVSLAV